MAAPLISLLHATRGRPDRARAARAQWLQAAADSGTIEHLFAFDADDAASVDALSALSHVVVRPGGSSVAAWNAAAASASGGVLIQMSDDWTAPAGWDRAVLAHLPEPELPRVLAVSDGHRTDRLLCMAILTRARLRDQGTLFHPGYASLWSDNEFTWRAHRDGVVVDAPELAFVHNHPLNDLGVPSDATYAAQNAPERFRKGRDLFLARNPGPEARAFAHPAPAEAAAMARRRMEMLRRRIRTQAGPPGGPPTARGAAAPPPPRPGA